MLLAGHWSAANWTRGQIVLMWLWSRNSECGRATIAFLMFASPGLAVRTALNAGLSPRLVPPLRLMESLGLKGRAEQPPTWKGLESAALDPKGETALPVSAIGSQLVGLRVKPGRSICNAIERTSSGMPW